MKIDSPEFGSITVNGIAYSRDILIRPARAIGLFHATC